MPLPSLISRSKSTATVPQPQPHEALPENTPLEFRVLLSACRLFLGTEEPAALEALLQQGPDWERLITQANRHGVMPLLYRSLSRVDRELVPQEAAARLRAMYMQNAARNIRMTGELLRILDAFKDAGIKAVPLKGPVLAEQLYGDVALRQFSDLDILVKREDAERALTILEEKGYRSIHIDPRQEKSEKKRAALNRSLHHYVMVNNNSSIQIELHWQLSPTINRLNTNEAAFSERTKILKCYGKEALILGNEDCLMFLFQHGARHLWKRLNWLCDVSKLIMLDNINYSLAQEIARDARNEKVFLLGFLLIKRLMNVPIPKNVIHGIKTDKDLINLSYQIIEGTTSFYDPPDDSSQKMADQILFKNFLSLRDKTAFYIDLYFDPTKPDFDFIPLPEVLFPAYKLVRPVRLIKEYGDAFKKQFKTIKKEK